MSMKKFTNLLLAAVMCTGIAACGSSDAASASEKPEPAAETASSEASNENESYLVGTLQFVQHAALDAATQGFVDVLTEEFGDKVTFDSQNASGDVATCSVIANSLVNEGVDLILANATPALQASAAATNQVPILGTAVTEYGTALDIDNFSGTVGRNISGTSDLAPLDQQAALFDELIPDAVNIGIVFCNAEANSVYQANVVEKALTDAGKTVTIYTFADTNDVSAVMQQACSEQDALYIPTDNTAASCTELIDSVALAAGVPIIAGEEGIAAGCGIATLSINYYDLGRTTGEMAVRILKGEDISTMPIEYFPDPVKKYVPARCEALGITVPDGFAVIE